MTLLAAVKEFIGDVDNLQNSVLFSDPKARTAIERLLALYNKVGEVPREPHERVRPRMHDWTQDPTKQIPAFELDPMADASLLRVLFESAKKEVQQAIAKAESEGHWDKINAQKHINEVEEKFDVLVRRKYEPIVDVAADFLRWIFTTAARAQEEINKSRERQSKAKIRLEDIQKFLEHVERNIDPQYLEGFKKYKTKTLADIQLAIDEDRLGDINNMVRELKGKKFMSGKGTPIVYEDITIAEIITHLFVFADILDQKGLYKEADEVADIALDYGRMTPEIIEVGDRVKFIPQTEGIKFVGYRGKEVQLYDNEWLSNNIGKEGVVETYPLNYARPEEDKNWAAVKFPDGGVAEVRVQDLVAR